MFYTKQIGIYTQSAGSKDEFGIWHEGSLYISKSIDCDVQPITKEIAFKRFGITEDVKYRMFCELIEGVETGVIVQYKDKPYRIVSLMEWDDYISFIVGDYDV